MDCACTDYQVLTALVIPIVKGGVNLIRALLFSIPTRVWQITCPLVS